MQNRIILVLCAGLMVGCGPDSKKPEVPVPGPVPVPVTLVSLSIGTDLDIAMGDVVALTAHATYSDTAVAAVPADWSMSPSGVVTLSAIQGTSITITAIGAGSTEITASFSTHVATITVTVAPLPPDESMGSVFGDALGGILRYPTDGSAPTYVDPGFSIPGRGMAITSDESQLYVVALLNGYYVIAQMDPNNPTAYTTVATLNGAAAPWVEEPFSMDIDSQGRVYLYCYDGGRVIRYDPEAGSTTQYYAPGSTFEMSFDSLDNLYWTPLLASAGATLITGYRYYPAYNISFATPWASAPADEDGYFVAAGLAFNSRDEAFVMNAYGTRVYRYVDVNGDGTAAGAGEAITFATLGGTYSDTFIFGISATRDGGILVNRQSGPGDSSQEGIWRVIDLNSDGNADGEAEITLFNATFTSNGFDPNCLVTPR